MKLVKASAINPGDRKRINSEEPLEEIKFKIHKFTPRNKPQKENVVIFPHFSEFGSELVASMYCLPHFLNTKYMGKYSIVMGWYGRAYLYKHLVDEYWEIDEQHQWLREYSRAFHHSSKNLKRAEKLASEFGKVIDLNEYGIYTVYKKLEKCSTCQGVVILEDGIQKCLACKAKFPPPGLYNNAKDSKKNAVWTPLPCQEKIEYVRDKYLRPNMVGVTARARTCYGRNLPPVFYERLIYQLEDLGYNIIWLGEKETTLACPVKRVTDFSRTEDARDLEMTLALVSQLKFTIQFWTASSRLAGLVGTPYILFESPDQLFNQGQEGYRINLCTKGNKKIVISHFVNINNNHHGGLELLERAIHEIENDNFCDIIGMVESEQCVASLKQQSSVIF